MLATRRALVTGAGGFIGHHLVKFLRALGYFVRGVDVKPPVYEDTDADEFWLLDLRELHNCQIATKGIHDVFHLAADMGGIGYISVYHADVARNNILMDAHMLEASSLNGVSRYFFASSACVYPLFLQAEPNLTGLREEDAHPADPEEGYGWEKLYAEKLCQYYLEEGKLLTRVARFHNIYGPLGSYEGGREKAPGALCRKIALASDGEEIVVWGDGKQTRSFTYIEDCVEGIYSILQCDYPFPLNLGTEELVSIDELVRIICRVANKSVMVRHDETRPQGVRGRNSDNSLLRKVLGWEPPTTLEEGIRDTYYWIESDLLRRARLTPNHASNEISREDVIARGAGQASGG